MKNFFKYTLGAKGWLKLWAIFLFSFPFYFFEAGSIQPSDAWIAIVIVLYAVGGYFNLKKGDKVVFVKFFRFCIYLTFINLGVYITLYGGDNKGLPWYIISAFYYYNLVVMGFALSLYHKYGRAFLYTTVYACIFAGILQVLLSFFLPTTIENIRGALFFNNPNQLGYYALSCLTIILILESIIKLPRWLVYLSFFLFSYLALVSVSKAAIGAMIILFIVYLFSNRLFSFKNVSVAIIVGGMGYFGITQTEFGERFQANLEVRESNEELPEGLTEWDYRGYDRIQNHPEYLILGAGEGGYNRFETLIDDHEIHSSIGTIIFCYGIMGTILFFVFINSLFKNLPWVYLIYSLPVFAYGLTHMGLRFTIFWIVLIIFPMIRNERRKVLRKKLLFEKNNSDVEQYSERAPLISK